MHICVTGVAGLIGSHLAEALIKDGHAVTGIDNLSGGELDNVPKKLAYFYDVSCENVRSFPSGTEVVVHCAALAHEGLSVFSPKLITDSVYGASVNMFSVAIRERVKRICYISSMSRFGNNPAPFTEDQKPAPVDPYGIAKVAAEDTLRCLCETHGVEYSIVVPHNVYGPRQNRSDPYRNVIAIFMNRLLLDKPPVIYGDGTQTRSFTYIDDLIPSMVKLATGNGFSGEVFNLGPDERPVSLNELFGRCVDAIGKSVQPVYVASRPCEVHEAWCSSAKAHEMIGYRTKTTLEQGLAKMAAWMKKVGPKPFDYNRELEIVTGKTPKTWLEKQI